MNVPCFVRRALGGLALLASACSPQANDDAPLSPDSFKVRLAVEPAAGDGAQRVILPAEAMIAIQRRDMGDVRIFDGRGRPLPLARGGALRDDAGQRSVTVPVYPVVGTIGGGAASDVTITIDAGNVARVVTQSGQGEKPGSAAALLDTRQVAGLAVAVTLDMALPVQRPVEVTLERSADLKQWQPLAQRVLFRPGADADVLGSGRFALSGENLEKGYVRATWQAAPDVSVRSASVAVADRAPLPRVAVVGAGIGMEGDRAVQFSVPFGTPLAALKLVETAPDGVVPVQVMGRDDAERPWQPIAAGILRQGEAGSVIDLGGTAFASYRIAADARSAGLSSPPRLELLFDPVEVLAAFNGVAPYTLAVGRAEAEPAWFDRTEVASAAELQRSDLPIARVGGTVSAAAAVNLAPADDGGPYSPRKLALWGALLLGVAVLAYAAIRLLRANAAQDQAGS